MFSTLALGSVSCPATMLPVPALVQKPVPTTGVFPDKVAVAAQTEKSTPATEGVGFSMILNVFYARNAWPSFRRLSKKQRSP